MQLPQTPDRITQHVAAFNAAVRSGGWAAFADRFTPGATMAFTAVPAGPFAGRAAIARAYADQPPRSPSRGPRAAPGPCSSPGSPG
jgi:ketosteroid isomerase-like protein